VLVDTSLLVRALQPQHPLCAVAQTAIDRLRLKERRLYVVPQNLVELWVVATRPAGENGLGLSFAEALAELARVKKFFRAASGDRGHFPGVGTPGDGLSGFRQTRARRTTGGRNACARRYVHSHVR